MYLISACLLGKNCKYNGGNNYCHRVAEFAAAHAHLAVCPETAAGLPVPRSPSEIRGGKVISREGEDRTEAFLLGAEQCYANALAKVGDRKIQGAILKANSPSCGCGRIYDGTFTGTLVQGDGFFTQLLKANHIKVTTEQETGKP